MLISQFLLKFILPTLCAWLGLAVLHNAWLAVLLYQTYLFLAITLKVFPPSEPYTFPFPSHSKLLIPSLIVLPLLVYLGLYLTALIFSVTHLPLLLAEVGLTNANFIPFAIFMSLFNGWLEELYWRRLGPTFSPFPLVSEISFALFHLPVLVIFAPLITIPLALIALCCGGLIWRMAYQHFNHLMPSVSSHLACNLAIWLWLYSHLAIP